MACWPTFLLRQYFLSGIVYFTWCVFTFYKPKTWLTRSLVRKSSGTLDPILFVKQWLESWDFWNYSHRFSQGSKDKLITLRSVKHGGKSWFKRQVWSQWLYDNVKHRPKQPMWNYQTVPIRKMWNIQCENNFDSSSW